MTFKDIIFKNIKCNIKNYYALIVCQILNIFVIYTFSSLYFNNNDGAMGLKPVLMVFFGIAIVFSFIFMNFIMITYNKSKSNELGVYLSLGMSRKDTIRYVWIENTVIAVISIIVGMMISMIVTRLLELMIEQSPILHMFSFKFNIIAICVTIIISITLYFLTIIYSVRYIKKHGIIQLFSDKEKENRNNSDLKIVFTIIGFLLLVGSLIAKSFINDTLSTKGLLLIIPFLVGIYFVISNFMAYLLVSLKRNNKKYYKHILHTMDLEHKFTQNKKTLYLLTGSHFIIMILILFCCFVASSLNNRMDRWYPYRITVYENVIDGKVEDNKGLYNLGDIKVKNQIVINNMNTHIPFVSNKQANQFKNWNLHVKEGYVINISNYENEGDITSIKIGREREEFIVQKHIKQIFCDGLNRLYVLSEEDYNRLNKKSTQHRVTIVEPINTSYHHIQKQLSDFITKHQLDVSIISKEVDFTQQSNGHRRIYFLFGIIIFIFFISSGTILYFKIFLDLDRDKKKYKNLWQIGIKEKEIRSSIAKELALQFFIPSIFGGSLGWLWLMINSIHDKYLITYSSIVIVIYACIQLILYYITQKSYINRVLLYKKRH